MFRAKEMHHDFNVSNESTGPSRHGRAIVLELGRNLRGCEGAVDDRLDRNWAEPRR